MASCRWQWQCICPCSVLKHSHDSHKGLTSKLTDKWSSKHLGDMLQAEGVHSVSLFVSLCMC